MGDGSFDRRFPRALDVTRASCQSETGVCSRFVLEVSLSDQSTAALLTVVQSAVDGLRRVAGDLQAALDMARAVPTPSPFPWSRDISSELPTNENCPGILADGWWQRTPDQIRSICFHHTCGWTDPHLLAAWYIQKDGGRPSTPYSIWISASGEVLLCNQLEVGCWHNHAGHENVDLSVALAGSLHIDYPPPAQLDAAARVAAWAIQSPLLPLVSDISCIKGHRDFYPTKCPGWDDCDPHWRANLYTRIGGLLP